MRFITDARVDVNKAFEKYWFPYIFRMVQDQ